MDVDPPVARFLGAWLAAYALGPILLLVHELGHARAVGRCGRRSTVFVGKSPALITRRFRTVDLHFHPLLGKSEIGHCVYDSQGLTVAQLRSITVAGPHATIVCALVLSAIAIAIADAGMVVFWTVTIGAAAAWAAGVMNLIPQRFETIFLSDGAMMALLQGRDPNAVPFPYRDGEGAGSGRLG